MYGTGTIVENDVLLAKPQTYMNESGVSVHGLLTHFRLPISALVVVYDERDLPVGRLRVRARGSAAGHRGLQSVIEHLGSSEFARIRIGIGRPPGKDAVDHVLSRFGVDELPLIVATVDRAMDAVEALVSQGAELAMNQFNE